MPSSPLISKIKADLATLLTRITGVVPTTPINRIQFFTSGNLQGNYSATATITAVDTAKTVIVPAGVETGLASGSPKDTELKFVLTNGTTVTVSRAGNDGTQVCYGSGFVVEYK